MKVYSHTQRAGRWLLIPVTIASGLVAGAALSRVWQFALGVPILALLGWLFSSLTVEVTALELRWRFGPGLIGRKVPVKDVVAAEAVTISWADGWGIHHTRFGWLHNIAGFQAIALRLADGRRFAVGTDDPGPLLAALQRAASISHAN